MSDIDLNASFLGWIVQNKIINERGDLIEFDKHKFLIEPASDWFPKQVCMKSAQVGWSTLAILKSLYALGYKKYNVIYTLPSVDDVEDFVPSKVDMMIRTNPILSNMVGRDGNDAMTRKEINGSFIWYRGSFTVKQAIMHSADVVISDELDASDPAVIDTYSSRLQYSKYKGEWKFSNPIRPGLIDQRYKDSDMRRWYIQCSRCNLWQVLDYFINVNKHKKAFECSGCKEVLSEEDRCDGQWVAEHPDLSDVCHGYHVSQLMVPWVTAKELMFLEQTKSQQYFYNMILGLPYVIKDEVVDIGMIRKKIYIKKNQKFRNAMGVDIKHDQKHYVIGNHDGIFDVGVVKTWQEIESLRNRYDATMVVDANPDFYARSLPDKYPGKCWIAFYRPDKERKLFVRWGDGNSRGIVYLDRTGCFSQMMEDFRLENGGIKFTTELGIDAFLMLPQMKMLVQHFKNLYKVVETDQYGLSKITWEHNGPDDMCHALLYQRAALSRVPTGSSQYPENPLWGKSYNPEVIDGGISTGPLPVLSKEQNKDGDSWLYPSY